MEQHAKKLNRKALAYRILVVVVLLLTCCTSAILAKYAKQKESGVSVGASNFYFRSDLLKENNASYMLNAGTDTKRIEKMQKICYNCIIKCSK